MSGGQERIINPERGGEVIVNEALENFKSMFNFMKGKRDTDIRVFHENRVIKRLDIIELNQKIQDKLANYNTQGNSVSINITFSDSDTKTFGNWRAFEEQEWAHSCFTWSIVIEWDFSIVFPNRSHEIPQIHSMRLRVGSGLRPNELFQVVMTGAEDFEINEAMADMVLKIDFVNTPLANDLKGIVTRWYNALPDNVPQGLLIRYTRRHRGKIELGINFIFIASAVFVTIVGVSTFIPFVNLTTNAKLLKWAYFFGASSFPLFYVFWKVSNFYSDRIIERTIERYKKAPMILLTRGDINKQSTVQSTNQKLFNDLLMKVAVTVIVAVGAFIIGKMIPAMLEWGIRIYLSK